MGLTTVQRYCAACDGDRPQSWIFKVRNFNGWSGSTCVIVPSAVLFGPTVDEMSRFSIFQDGGRGHLVGAYFTF